MKSIIILTPTYKSNKILPYYFRSVHKLDPQPDRYIFLENNSRDKLKTIRTLWRLAKTLPAPYEIHRLWFHADINKPPNNPYTSIAIARQILLERARKLDPDHAIFLDDDIYVNSPDMINALTIWNEDIVGGAYLRIFPEGIFLASKWQAPNPKRHRLHYFMTKALDEPLMTSAGCLCLSRRVIQDQRINFWPMSEDHPEASEDFGFCYAARKHGYKIFLDGTVRLSHALTVKSRIKKPWTTNEKGKYIEFEY